MFTNRSMSRMFSVLLIVIFLLTGVLPVRAESLASPLYADVNFVWAKRMGGADSGMGVANSDGGTDIVIDSSGNVYTTGQFVDTADFDPGAGISNLTSAGTMDIFVSKLDSNGNFTWAKRMGGASDDVGSSIVIDSSGNVYITGSFTGTADFNPGAGTSNLTSAGSMDIFVSKLDSSGNFVWAKSMGGASYDVGSSIVIDSSGNVYTTGGFGITDVAGTITADFDPGAGTFNLTNTGSGDIFVSKLDSNGSFVWAKSMGGASGRDQGNSIVIDSSGNAYTTGEFQGTIDFNPGVGTFNLASVGIYDIFISKLDSNGSFVWAKSIGGIKDDYGSGIAIDSSSNVYTTGSFSDLVDFDPGAGTFNLTALGFFVGGFDDVFVSKLDSNGNFVWAKKMGGTSSERANGIVLDSSSNVYTTGDFNAFYGPVDFDPGPGTFNLASVGGSSDIFVSKLDSNGNFSWAKSMGGADYEHGSGIALDSNSNVYTTGSFYDTADFDPGADIFNLTSAGSRDIFISKLERDVGAPTVSSIVRLNPNPTAASSVSFTVTFSEPVTGVDIIGPAFNDFVLTTSGVTGATVSGVSGSGSVYTVTVNTGSGNGTIRLDAKTGGGIVDGELYPFAKPYTSGEVYTITKTGSILTGPVNGGYVTTAMPTFTWTAVTGALEYHLQVDTTDWFTTPEVDRFQPSGTSYVSPALDYGAYYWRMQARTASGWGTWTPAWKLTLTPSLPLVPVLVSPANAALLVDNTPTLSWNMLLEDDRYEVQIDNLSTFASPEQTFLSGTGGLNYTATLLPDGLYYWRVRTSNYLSVPGPWSAYRSFTIDTTPPIAPVLSTPADAASVIGTPAFAWLTTATATKYEFQYDNDANFSSPIYTSIEVTTLNHTPPAMALGAYSWHVRAKDAVGNWGVWSTPRTITILPLVPIAPVLSLPANAIVTNDSTPDFTWASVVSGNTYELEISNATTFATKQQTFIGGVGVLNYTATTIPDGIWYWHVRALNVNSVAGAWSAYRSFTIDTTPPIAPVLSTPADAASVIGTPSFAWLTTATATKYEFQYDNDANFSSPIYTSIEVTTLNHTPPAIALGTYSWHVRAKDAVGNWGAWSLPRTITILPLVPIAPTLTAPVNAFVTNDATPDFSWASVVSGNTYELEISNATTFATKQQTFIGAVGVLNYTATTIPDGIWYWHVRALNVNSVAGAWSAYRSFTIDTTPPIAPVLSTPANAASMIGTPSFAWLTTATATKYEFQYDNDANFSSPTYTSIEVTTLNHTPPAMALGTYSWHVRAKDAVGNWGVWSLPRTITILPLVPIAPVLNLPAASLVTNDSTPDFSWASVVSGNTYELEISNATTFATKQQTFIGGVGVLNYTATTIPDGIWYWHVRALNVNSVAGAWSAYRSFTIDTTPPIAPVLSTPADAASVIGTPSFVWLTTATATKYEFQYDNDANFSSPTYTSIEVTTLNHTPPAMALGSYSWHVRAKDAVGNWGVWSTPRTITILPLVPIAPVLSLPANAFVTNDSTPDFNWASVVSGNTYELEISNATTFATKQQTFIGGVGVLNYTATTIPDGIWYWHVRALNVNSVAGAWSAYRSFTIDTTPPIAPVLSTPADAASVIGTPSFAWLTTATATKYEFQYDNDANFSSPTYTSAEVTTLNHTPPAMALGSYSWHVRAKDAVGNWGVWSLPRTVTILPLVPIAPVLNLPANAFVTNDSTPDFTWASVVSGNTYELEISNATTFATKQQTFIGGVGVLNYTATTIPDGIWYWHVRALNVNSVAGAWSAYRSFTIDTTPPIAPVLSTPADAASVIGTPSFVWLTTATATKYEFQYDNDANFSSPTYTSIEVTTLNHTPPAMALGTYSWHVRAKDAVGNWGVWSTPRTITILPLVPIAPVLSLPANAIVTNDSTPDFSWASVVSGNTYELEISNATTFATKQQTFIGGVGVLNYTATTIPDGIWYWHVRALNVNSIAGAWSAYRSFTIDTTAPIAPVLSTPADAASVIGTPAFAWLTTATASKYEFQYDNDANFSSPIYTSIEVTTLNHTPPAMALGTYSWHVRAKDAVGNWGAWSLPRTITILPLVPIAPVLNLPAASLVTNDATPDFSWNSVASGNTYELEISNATTFATKQQTFSGAVGVLNYTATTIPDGIWYWHVRALNVNSVAGAWSAYRSFTIDTTPPIAPVLSTPADAASVIGTPAFAWLTTATATKYEFQYDNDANFSSPIYTSVEVTTLNHTPPAMALGTYSWHVRAKDVAGNWGVWSLPRTVNIVPLVPATPTLTSPANGSVSQNPAPALNWGALAGAVSYQVQMDTNSTFSSPEFDNSSATNSITPPALADGVYYWHVRQTDTLGGVSAWSAAWRVTISQPIPFAPGAASLRSMDTSHNQNGMPTFNWDSVEYGAVYQIQVDDSEDFSSPLFDDTADTTSRAILLPLSIGEYFWHVRAINEYGTAGPWSETWMITIDIPPAAPTLLLPTEASISSEGDPIFSWQSATNAVNYQIQVDEDEEFSSPLFDDVAETTTRELVTPLTDGTYFWRVRTANIYDTASEWSETNTFTISLPPSAPTLLTPETDAIDTTGLPTFSWEVVVNGLTYQIQVDDSADFSSPLFDDTAETTTRELVTPLENGLYYWRVRAINIYDVSGEWSEVWTFTLDVTEP